MEPKDNARLRGEFPNKVPMETVSSSPHKPLPFLAIRPEIVIGFTAKVLVDFFNITYVFVVALATT